METIRIFRTKGKSENDVIYKHLRDIEALEEYVNDILTPQERIKLHYHNTAEFIIFASIGNIDSDIINISPIFSSDNKVAIQDHLDTLVNILQDFAESAANDECVFYFRITPMN